jgi:hypothetical protein
VTVARTARRPCRTRSSKARRVVSRMRNA